MKSWGANGPIATQAQTAERYEQTESLLSAQFFALRYNLWEILQTTQQQIGELELALEKTLPGSVIWMPPLSNSVRKVRSVRAGSEIQQQFYQLGTEITRIEETLQFNQQRSQQLQEDLTSAEQRRTGPTAVEHGRATDRRNAAAAAGTRARFAASTSC